MPVSDMPDQCPEGNGGRQCIWFVGHMGKHRDALGVDWGVWDREAPPFTAIDVDEDTDEDWIEHEGYPRDRTDDEMWLKYVRGGVNATLGITAHEANKASMEIRL